MNLNNDIIDDIPSLDENDELCPDKMDVFEEMFDELKSDPFDADYCCDNCGSDLVEKEFNDDSILFCEKCKKYY